MRQSTRSTVAGRCSAYWQSVLCGYWVCLLTAFRPIFCLDSVAPNRRHLVPTEAYSSAAVGTVRLERSPPPSRVVSCIWVRAHSALFAHQPPGSPRDPPPPHPVLPTSPPPARSP